MSTRFRRIRTPADPPPAGSTASGQEQFLLLTDGRLIQGIISREDSFYIVKQRIGVMRFPKKLVEGSFASLQETYQYKIARLPEDDTSERLKLARWCLNFHLTAEAKEQLLKVMEISPKHGPAQAMLSKLQQAETTKAKRYDPAIQQTGAEEVREDRAGARDEAVLRGAERAMGVPRLPVIFDLPRPLAIKKADEFVRFIQPVLQLKCAKCHNAGYNGPFQLVPIVNVRQLTTDAVRANLDATLRLIDPENLSKSELLSSTLRPNHNGPKSRPIFAGSNDRAYQILAAWVNSLQSPQQADANVRQAAGLAQQGSEKFGSDRSRPPGASLETELPGLERGTAAARGLGASVIDPKMNSAFRYKPGQGIVPEDLEKADPKEFPLPYMLGGPKPTLAKQPAKPLRKSDGSPSSAKSADTALPVLPDDEAEPASADPTKSGRIPPPKTLPKTTDRAAAKSTPKKPASIDPAILEKLLQRNANRTPEQ